MTLRPFVDRRVVDLDAADAVARKLAVEWSLAPPTLLRRGMNAIYASGDVVLRVGRASAPAAAAHRLAALLLDRGVSIGPPIEGLSVDRDGFAVTGWERIRPANRAVDWEAVGSTVRRVHEIEPSEIPGDYPVPPPSGFPWWDFDALVAEVANRLDSGALAGLTAAIDRRRGWKAMVDHDAVVCHGDVHPGNVLMTADGPVLIDWDLLCEAHPAWDHAMLTTYADRWGGDAGVYPAFSSGYGRDLGDDPVATTVAELRNVAATLMRVRAGSTDESARAEAERRLRYWRGDPDAPVWTAQ